MKSHKNMSLRNQVSHQKILEIFKFLNFFFRYSFRMQFLEQVYGGQMSQDSGGIAIPGNLTEEVTLNGTSMTEDDEGKCKK